MQDQTLLPSSWHPSAHTPKWEAQLNASVWHSVLQNERHFLLYIITCTSVMNVMFCSVAQWLWGVSCLCCTWTNYVLLRLLVHSLLLWAKFLWQTHSLISDSSPWNEPNSVRWALYSSHSIARYYQIHKALQDSATVCQCRHRNRSSWSIELIVWGPSHVDSRAKFEWKTTEEERADPLLYWKNSKHVKLANLARRT